MNIKFLLAAVVAIPCTSVHAADDADTKFAVCVQKAAVKPGMGYTSGDRGRSAALLLHNECRAERDLWVRNCIASATKPPPEGAWERECKLRAGISAQAALLLNECKLRQATDAGIPC